MLSEAGDRGLVVLGMHRSGTSALTGLIDALGVPACAPTNRMGHYMPELNDHFESFHVSRFDENFLRAMGGTWYAPPDLPYGWWRWPELSTWRVAGLRAFKAVHPDSLWVWKDPRACLLLPLWDTVFGGDIPRIISLRHPLNIARSLEARNQMSIEQSMALTERYLRSAFLNCRGRPTLVVEYDSFMDSVSLAAESIAAFLAPLGIEITTNLGPARQVLQSDLRHHRVPSDDGSPALPDPIRPLWEWARTQVGEHRPMLAVGIPGESEQAAAVIDQARSALDLRPHPGLAMPA